MNQEEFKIKIIRQLKDPDSALNYLLSIPNGRSWTKGHHRNISKHDLRFYVSEFNIQVDFKFSPELVFDKDAESSVPIEPGGHHVLFRHSDNKRHMLDISDMDSLRKMQFLEEGIAESPHKPNALIFGLKSFFIYHDDYEFHRVYQGTEWLHATSFSLATLSFCEEYKEAKNEWASSYANGSGERFGQYYLQYFAPNIKDIPLLDGDLKSELFQRMNNELNQEWENSRAGTHLTRIAETLEAIIVDQSLSVLPDTK